VADETTPLGQAYQAYERLEGQLSVALEKLVATNGFADLLATSATNVMAMTRLANGAVDRVVRTTRLAARHDVTELARQLARTEAKLERLLQAVEELQGQLEAGSAVEPAKGVVSSAPVEIPEPELAPANGTVRNGTSLAGGTGRVRASRAAATRAAAARTATKKTVAKAPATEAKAPATEAKAEAP
jgi:hypothetical protein